MSLFSMEGRYNRAKYFWIMFGIGFVTQFFRRGIALVIVASGGNTTIAGIIGFLIGVGGMVFCAVQTVKRLHDLNRPGDHYWLFFIPIYNIYFSLIILFKKGIEGSNKYGSDPLGSKKNEI